MAESVMIELTRKGMDRQDAHEHVRIASMKALERKCPLSSVREDPVVLSVERTGN